MPSLHDTLEDLEFIASQEAGPAEQVYDRAASRYEHFRELWLRLAGRDAERSMVETLRATLRPGARVLDAGCGTVRCRESSSRPSLACGSRCSTAPSRC